MALNLRRRRAPAVVEQFAEQLADGVELPLWRSEPSLPPVRSRTRARVVVLGGFVLLLVAMAYGYDHISATHYFPGTRIGGVLIGSRGADEAQAILHERFVMPLHRPVTITAPELATSATPWEMGLRIDVNAVTRQVLDDQRATPMLERWWHRAAGADGNASLESNFDAHVLDTFARGLVRTVNRDPVDARLEIKGNALHVVPDRVGRRITAEAVEASIVSSVADGEETIKLPVRTTPAAIRAASFTKVLLVSTSDNTLKFYTRGKLTKAYDVATGTGGYPTPLGTFEIVDKQEFPTWFNPHDPWSVGMPEYIPPGPDNPLGTRAMGLSASGILIHGTPNDWSIGSNASHGCIRMHMSDAEQLFELVDVGTPVMIV